MSVPTLVDREIVYNKHNDDDMLSKGALTTHTLGWVCVVCSKSADFLVLFSVCRLLGIICLRFIYDRLHTTA